MQSGPDFPGKTAIRGETWRRRVCQPDGKREETACTETLRREGPSWEPGCARGVAGKDPLSPALLQEMQSDKQAKAP